MSLINCSICFEHSQPAGYTCSCRKHGGEVCISCEISFVQVQGPCKQHNDIDCTVCEPSMILKCPFCRAAYPSWLERASRSYHKYTYIKHLSNAAQKQLVDDTSKFKLANKIFERLLKHNFSLNIVFLVTFCNIDIQKDVLGILVDYVHTQIIENPNENNINNAYEAHDMILYCLEQKNPYDYVYLFEADKMQDAHEDACYRWYDKINRVPNKPHTRLLKPTKLPKYRHYSKLRRHY